jgi:hypothetical protein
VIKLDRPGAVDLNVMARVESGFQTNAVIIGDGDLVATHPTGERAARALVALKVARITMAFCFIDAAAPIAPWLRPTAINLNHWFKVGDF